nr:hypothetical protein [Tanacetum cinerariifolium]
MPLTHIPLRAILGMLQIGIRAKVIENQVKNTEDPEEDDDEDPEEDPADYPAD